MQIKSVLFGFGLGLVLLSTVILIAYRFEDWNADRLYDEMIISYAEELGMVWPTDDMAEVVRQAFDMGMVFLEESDSRTYSD